MKKPMNWSKIWRKFKIYMIFAVAVFAFAILGMFQDSSIFTGGGVAAEVNKKSISLKDFNLSYERFRNRMGENFGSGAQAEYFENMMRQNILNQLISLELVQQEALNMGIVPSDQEVTQQVYDILEGIPGIEEAGDTKRDQYNAVLRSQRSKPREFEDGLRKQLSLDHIRNFFDRSVYSSPIELENEAELSETKFELDFISFRKADLAIKVSDSDVESYKNENKSEVQAYYEKNPQEFTTKEQVRARHILIGFQKENKKSDTEALKKIKTIEKQLDTVSFEELAEKWSQDPGSQSQKGDLGYFSRGKMVPAFDEVAFSLDVGQVSAPVKTDFGYHLIKVEDKKKPVKRELVDVEMEISKKLLQKKRLESLFQKLELALKNSEPVESLLKDLGLSWEKTGEFDLSSVTIPKVGDKEDFYKILFTLNPETPVAQSMVINDGKYYLLKLRSQKTVSGASGDEAMPLTSEKKLMVASKNKSSSIFNAWLEERSKKATIKRNPQIFNN